MFIGDQVCWVSSGKFKMGEIVAKVPEGFLPKDYGYKVAGAAPRNHDSFIVKANGRFYWPRASLLSPSIRFGQTKRGFHIGEFTDLSGNKCSLQTSSIIHEEGVIWLGCSEIGLKHFKAGQGWRDVEMVHTVEEHYVANNRMHLTQTQVKALLPALIHFAETGDLP